MCPLLIYGLSVPNSKCGLLCENDLGHLNIFFFVNRHHVKFCPIEDARETLQVEDSLLGSSSWHCTFSKCGEVSNTLSFSSTWFLLHGRNLPSVTKSLPWHPTHLGSSIGECLQGVTSPWTSFPRTPVTKPAHI